MANYRIRMKSEKAAEIMIYDDIGESWFGGISAKQFAEDLKALGKDIVTLQVRINSPGGDVFDAMAMYNTLRRHNARKEVSIDGMALSAATVVAMAGDKISMAENAMFMIHNPWSITMGTAEDMRAQADVLDQVRENIVTTYERRTKNDGEHIRALMDAETWMRGGQAMEEGFVDEVTKDLAIAAHFDPTRFKNVPPELRSAVQKKAHTPRADLVRARTRELAQRAGRL